MVLCCFCLGVNKKTPILQLEFFKKIGVNELFNNQFSGICFAFFSDFHDVNTTF